MKVSNAISFRVFNIVQKKPFVKDILHSIVVSSGKALLVGGAVRDLFLERFIQDLDFEVYGLSLDQLKSILEQYGSVSLIGSSFGVLRLHGLDVDWSLPRTDSSGRHPVVAYDPAMSYQQAFIRRDVTVNAMGVDMQTLELIDPYGGLQDLQTKILRAPDLEFFAQDPLRLLRVMQFAARFEMSVDQQLTDLCAKMDMSKVSLERIEQEFAKLFLQSQRPSIGLQWLVQINKFHEFLPGVLEQDSLWNMIDAAAVQQYQNDQEKLLVMWAVVMSFLDSQSNYVFEQLRNQNLQPIIQAMRYVSRHDHLIMQVARLVSYARLVTNLLSDRPSFAEAMAKPDEALAKIMADRQLKWLAFWLAPDFSIRLVSKFIALRYNQQTAECLAHQAEKLGVVDLPEQPLLTGKDLLDVAQGVQLGLLVKKAYEIQIERGVTDPDELKSLVC